MNVRELLLGNVAKLAYMQRFSGQRVYCHETVAAHSFFVCFYAHQLCMHAIRNGLEPEVEAVLIRAIYHDLEECMTGDFPRPFKYSDETTKAALDLGARKCFLNLSEAINEDPATRILMRVSWENAKDDTLEGFIIEFADHMSAVSYILQEVKSGNWQMYSEVKNCRDYFQVVKSRCRWPEFDSVLGDHQCEIEKVFRAKRD